jgi:uncharacterized protein (UPF0332 family)
MSLGSLQAAESLRKLKNRRSCVSRAYYAAFQAITGEVRKKTTAFPKRYEHPPHRQVGKYVKRYLTQFSRRDRNDIRDALSRLRTARENADYRQNPDPGDAAVKAAMLDVRFVLQRLGRI